MHDTGHIAGPTPNSSTPPIEEIMKYIITGTAGFIGTTTALRLLSDGHEVCGIDSLTDHYDLEVKAANLSSLQRFSNFTFSQADLTTGGFEELFDGVDSVLHLAAQPGVRKSWLDFTTYARANIEATKHVLDLCLRFGVRRVVYASSSSVYGNATQYPTSEEQTPAPTSPYAVTKLAGEHLCRTFAAEHDLSTVSLRYFTVYGPRQRPDMLTHRLIEAAETGTPISIFGSGDQVRDFTFVDDVARANIAATTADVPPGSVYNIAGGSSVSVNQMISAVEAATGKAVERSVRTRALGDVDRTGGDTTAARNDLDWEPTVRLTDGLDAHVSHYRQSNALSNRR